MAAKLRIQKFGILIIVLLVVVYTIWFVFCQDLIQYILENAISTFTGEKDTITGWFGVIFIPFLIVCGILGIIGAVLYIIERRKEPKIS
ncbi:MAG: hypothetical protein JSV62_11380 [Promethearchaeota archaeon]|nr:MAG: hypothetical protein JSV62_11380 [Candidatus Lokiarchaeota archaeon]